MRVLPSRAPLRFTRHRNHSSRETTGDKRFSKPHTELTSEIPLELRAKTSLGVDQQWPPEDWTPQRSVEAYSALIENCPQYGFLYFRRAGCRGFLVNAQDVIEDTRRAIELCPENWNFWYRWATRTLLAGDRKEYEEICFNIVERFSSSENDTRADLVRFCSLAPLSPSMQKRMLNIAEDAFSKEDYLDSRIALGIAAYRCGQYQQAIDVLPDYRPDKRKGAVVLPIAAMAHQKLGETEKARKLLQRGRIAAGFFEPTDTVDATSYVTDSGTWGMLKILLEEAESMID